MSTPPDLNKVTDDEARSILQEAIPKATFGFPVTAFKKAAAAGGKRAGVTKNKVDSFGAFHILGISVPHMSGEYVPIYGKVENREDMVRIGQGTADLRYRACFPANKTGVDCWHTTLDIEYNKNAISAEQLVMLFNYGGFVCGVGEWRPEKGGSYGRFRVATETA